MNYVQTIYQLGMLNDIFSSVDTLLDNVYVLTAIVTILLIGNASLNNKKTLYYNQLNVTDKNGIDKMKSHSLNTKYHFDEKRKLDIEEINKTYMKFHISAAFVFLAVSLIATMFTDVAETALIAGFVAFFAYTLLGNMKTTDMIGKKYEDVK